MVIRTKLQHDLVSFNYDSKDLRKDFINRFENILGQEEYQKFMKYNFSYLDRCIRVNTLKADSNIIEKLSDEWMIEEIPFAKDAYYIRGKTRKDVGNLMLHKMGFIYVQEAASMIPPIVLDPKPGEIVLDMAAAPGSKTTQIASMMENEGLIFSNDLSFSRLGSLKVNISRCGIKNTIITNMNGIFFGNMIKNDNKEKLKIHKSNKDSLKKVSWSNNFVYDNMRSNEKNITSEDGFFDKVLLDAPCSGSGTIRKSTNTLKIWNKGAIIRMQKAQFKLIDVAFNILKIGGTLVYSTCSLEPEENEFVIDFLLKKYKNVEIEKIELPSITKGKPILDFEGTKLDERIENVLRIYPHNNDTEGFFICKIKKI